MDGFRRPEHKDVLTTVVRQIHDGEATAIRNDAHLLTLLQVYCRAKPGGEFVEALNSPAEIAALDIRSHEFCALLESLDFYYHVSVDYSVTERGQHGLLRFLYVADSHMLDRLNEGSSLPENFRRGRFFGYPESALVGHFSAGQQNTNYDSLLPKVVAEDIATPDELAIQQVYGKFVPKLTPEGIREAVDFSFTKRAEVRRFIEFSGLTMAHEILDKLEADAVAEIEQTVGNASDSSK